MPTEAIFTDGNYTIARPLNLPVFEAPFDGVNAFYLLRQTWYQNQADKTPLGLNTPHPDHDDFFLVHEGPEQDMQAGVVQWERTYAKVPASYNEPGGTYTYEFIGYLRIDGGVNEYFFGRPRFTEVVPAKLQHDFFLVGTNGSYATWQEIPMLQAQDYHLNQFPQIKVNFLADSPPLPASELTVPDLTTYKAMISADAAAADSFSLIVETTKPERWMGNIYRRDTLRIKAR